MMKLTRPSESEYDAAFRGYVSLVPEADVLQVLSEQQQAFEDLSRTISSEKSTFRYEAGKWSIRQLVRHVADAERVFAYRALTFARGDDAALPSFEEDLWAKSAPADEVPFSALVSELVQLRGANLLMLRYLDDEAWKRRGKANGREITVRAIAYVMAGHARHHLRVLRERYLAQS